MKRSSSITLTMMASAGILTAVAGCGPETPTQPVNVVSSIYSSVDQCKADGNSPGDCDRLAQTVATAPKFTNKADCEAQFGPSSCETKGGDGGGSSTSFFGPMMMGYMLGSMGNGSNYNYASDYNRYRGSTYYSRDLGRTQTGFYNTQRTAPNVLSQPKALPVQQPATVRGGFGQNTRAKAMNSASPRAMQAAHPKGAGATAPKSRGGFGSSARGGAGG